VREIRTECKVIRQVNRSVLLVLEGDVSGRHKGRQYCDEGEDSGKDVKSLLVEYVVETGCLVIKLVDEAHHCFSSMTFGF